MCGYLVARRAPQSNRACAPRSVGFTCHDFEKTQIMTGFLLPYFAEQLAKFSARLWRYAALIQKSNGRIIGDSEWLCQSAGRSPATVSESHCSMFTRRNTSGVAYEYLCSKILLTLRLTADLLRLLNGSSESSALPQSLQHSSHNSSHQCSVAPA